MTLRAAVQMDPMDGINIAGDSSFALMLKALERGHTLYHYDVRGLTWEAGRLTTPAHPVLEVKRVKGDHYRFGDPVTLDLGYLTGTWLLERIRDETLVVNDPVSVRNAPEKVFVLDFPQFMPPTMVTRDLNAVKDFHARHGALVIKPLHGNGGKAVFRIDEAGTNLGALVELFGQVWPEPFMVQQFLPSVSEGDKRIVLIDGEVADAINRKAGEGEFRANLAVGGYAEAAALTPREEEICAALAPALRERGLIFVGIDVIGGEWLTEINVTSPTGIVAIDKFNNSDTVGMIWDAIERRIG